jgi:hypothetical protein
MSRARLCIAIAVATFTFGARAQPSIARIPATKDTATPIQRGLRAMFAERAAAGLPVPASAEYTYEVVEGAPYPNVAAFDVAWAASDALSGIAEESGWLDGAPVENGEPIALLLFVPGPHVVSVATTDRADHEVDASVTFDVTIDLVGLLAAQARLCDLDWINKLGICNSLEAKLLAAQASQARGDLGAAANELGAYVHELEAQWNKAINPRAYELLLVDVQYVLAHLG